MKRKKHAKSTHRSIPRTSSGSRTWLVLCACLFTAFPFPPATGAQDTNGQAQDKQVTSESSAAGQGDAGAQGNKQPTAAEMVTDYLKQDIFVRPGVGLKKVKIGMPFDQVLKAWGKPTSKGGTINNQWTYQVGNETKITLSGDNEVKVMTIAGGFNTPYVTTEGASFGMPQYQLATIYGSAKEVAGKIMYNDRGIGFVMDRGQVSGIQVFAPR